MAGRRGACCDGAGYEGGGPAGWSGVQGVGRLPRLGRAATARRARCAGCRGVRREPGRERVGLGRAAFAARAEPALPGRSIMVARVAGPPGWRPRAVPLGNVGVGPSLCSWPDGRVPPGRLCRRGCGLRPTAACAADRRRRNGRWRRAACRRRRLRTRRRSRRSSGRRQTARGRIRAEVHAHFLSHAIGGPGPSTFAGAPWLEPVSRRRCRVASRAIATMTAIGNHGM